jgi:hypothetical protein
MSDHRTAEICGGIFSSHAELAVAIGEAVLVELPLALFCLLAARPVQPRTRRGFGERVDAEPLPLPVTRQARA